MTLRQGSHFPHGLSECGTVHTVGRWSHRVGKEEEEGKGVEVGVAWVPPSVWN